MTDLVLTNIEMAVMRLLLAGDHPVLSVLREQFASARITSRESSPVGFFTEFEVPSGIKRVTDPSRFDIHGVDGVIPGIDLVLLFILFITDGAISMLECATAGDGILPPPEEIDSFELWYGGHQILGMSDIERHLKNVEETLEFYRGLTKRQ